MRSIKRLGDKFRAALLWSLIALCAAFMLFPGAALAGTLDQQQADSSGSPLVIHSAQSLAQTFTAGLTGGLDRVDLSLTKQGAPPSALIVELRDASGGAPGSTVLASQSVLETVVPPGVAEFVSINFPTPASVVAGTQYAIVAYSATPTINGSYVWPESSTVNPYAGGASFFTSNSPPSGSWASAGLGDQAFKTYVVPSNAFTLGAVTRNKKKGTATLNLNVPNPGDLSASGTGAKVAGVAGAVTSKAVGAGIAQFLIKAKGKKKKKLNEKGKVKLNVAVTYTPTRGQPSTQSIRVKLKKKL